MKVMVISCPHILPWIGDHNTGSKTPMCQFADVIETPFKLSEDAKVWGPSYRIFEASLAIDRGYYVPGIVCSGSAKE